MKPRFVALRGTRDILPDEAARWRVVEETARDTFARYGYGEIRTPIFEATELFARSVGDSTDIVRKEMYTFEAGGESVSLRPENTAPVVRAFVEHALYRTIAAGFPERYYYIAPMFRYERPQKGRQRQFHQIGVEVLGSAEPLVDAETIEMAWAFLSALGIPGLEIRINSVGDGTCRPRFRDALRDWLEPRLPDLCDDCRRRYTDNPLRVFDCKVEADRLLLADAPTVATCLCDGCGNHMQAVRAALDAYGIPYVVDPRMVRGLDYYERTVFEVIAGGLGSQNALLGGGRYDGLVEDLGGPPIPGFGFALGMERLVMLLPAGATPPRGPDLALIGLGEAGWRASLALARRLRSAGLHVTTSVVDRPLGAQMKRAERVRARFAVFCGADELASGRLGVKDLRSGEQVAMDEAALIARVRAARTEG